MHVLQFKPDGTASSLWTEAIPLADLGTMTINRASSIEYDNVTQLWEVKLADCLAHTVFRSTSREECLLWEHTHFNNELLEQ